MPWAGFRSSSSAPCCSRSCRCSAATWLACSRTSARRPQSWKGYAFSVITFSLLSWLLLFLILRTQTLHPLNPNGFHSGTWDLSFNTASSFVTNTNWQFYGGETTLSAFSQMAGLAVQNFLSAAVGICVLIALMRGIASKPLGNFFEDLTRVVLRVLLPISVIGALVLASQGVVQSLDLPVASQEVIKVLGTNGGGFFNVNSAMPFENPNGLDELPRDARDARDPGFADLHVRPDRR